MPSILEQSAKGRMVMIRAPFEQGQDESRHTRIFQEYSWNSNTSGKFLGSLGKAHRGHHRRRCRESYPGLAGLQTAFGMEIAGTTPVPSSPAGPGNNQLHTAWSRPEQASKQMTHFRNRQGKQRSRISRRITSRRGLWDKRKGSHGDVLGADPCQEGVSQHHQGDMAIPPEPASDFVLIQSHIFAGFKVFLNMPAGADGLHHLAERGSRWGKDEVVGLLSRIGEAPTNEQPVASIRFPAMQDRDDCPVKEPGTFGSLTHREALPLLLMQHERFHAVASSISRHDPNGFIAGHGQYI